MIRFFLLLLVFASGGLGFAHLLKEEGPGYVLIYFNHYSIETSFWLFTVLMLVLSGGLMLAIWLFFNGAGLLVRLGLWPRRFSLGQAHKQQFNGLLAYADADYSAAGKVLNRAGKRGNLAFVDYLFAARSALQLNQFDEAQAAFEKARECGDKDDLSVALFGVDMALALNDDARAQQRLEDARGRFSNDPRFLIKAAMVYHAVHEWTLLQGLLKPLRKKKLLVKAQFEMYTRDCFAGLITQAAAINDLSAVNKAFKQADTFQLDEHVYMAYFRALQSMGENAEARNRVEHQLRQQWSAPLLAFYLQLAPGDVGDQAVFVRRLAEAQPGSALILHAQGIVATRQANWLEAKKFFEDSLAIQETAKAWFLLADVYAQLHQPSQQAESVKKGLALMAPA
ncbi:Protein HemY [BD1-7 clade bacterium]|uniref:Protein HemY n=1 Tax=BD1-7 clade bacterium TaxID=2029982 RepID=A0A5S9QEB5_9GAMM|nr:Protein HemY [BD1-7 clade bacterium]